MCVCVSVCVFASGCTRINMFMFMGTQWCQRVNPVSVQVVQALEAVELYSTGRRCNKVTSSVK